MAEILFPRPASTVLTLRDALGGYEILMLRRNLNSDFVGGAYVFPGGSVDDDDAGPAIQYRTFGRSDPETSSRLSVASGGIAYYVAGVRELFEEAGLLIACDEEGEPLELADDETVGRMAEHRRGLNNGSVGFVDVLDLEGLFIDLRPLEYIGHWVTPIGLTRRFDTRFFVARAPRAQVATHDAYETVANQWVRPAEALLAHARGDLEMILPTIRNLEAIAHFVTVDEVLEYARSLTDIVKVEPYIVEVDGESRTLLPGDENYAG